MVLVAERFTLEWYRNNQDKVNIQNADLSDAKTAAEMDRIGRKTILTLALSVSPNWHHAKKYDALALLREYRKMDFFLTMTANPNWLE